MNTLLKGLKNDANLVETENGAKTYKSTMSGLKDLFALGGAYRERSEADCIFLFKKAYEEDPLLAMKCLFFLGDVRGGEGERRFFKTCLHWLADNHPEVVKKNLSLIPFYTRWDNLYALVGTPLECSAFDLMYEQLKLDIKSETPSLLAKWLKSENTSSKESRELAYCTMRHFCLNPREYRKILSHLRERIKVLERLMSQNRWDEIKFDKIPSKAGFKYRNAFARNDVLKERYKFFAKDKKTKVNADVLYPYEVVSQARDLMGDSSWMGAKDVPLDDTQRLMINKYWDNLRDVLNQKPLNGIVVADTSGSMWGDPINVALSLAMYCAERASGPFANHFITFSRHPELVEFSGVDFCDKVARASSADWGMNTDIVAVFNLILCTALKNEVPQSEMPEKVIIVSDMQFDNAVYYPDFTVGSLFDSIREKWEANGYKLPQLIFWNVRASNTGGNIPMRDDANGQVCYCSGFSPVLFEQILECKTAEELMLSKLNSERYAAVTV